MRLQDWTGFVALAAILAAVAAFAAGSVAWGVAGLAIGAIGGWWTRHRSLTHPGPMPYALRWTLLFPRGNHSPRHLRNLLGPARGERILEIGPGVGIHALPVASSLGPDGALDVFDLQQEMLDHVMRMAAAAGVGNIAPRRGSAHSLPYADAQFDGAYLVGVLGEIPDGPAALRELRRVLKPGGRLVIGEVVFDPDYISPSALERLARDAGFVLERRVGAAPSYLARFRPA